VSSTSGTTTEPSIHAQEAALRVLPALRLKAQEMSLQSNLAYDGKVLLFV
jgi:hypothetical protein